MNLRKEGPEKKKRGRPETKYSLSFKGYLHIALFATSVDVEVFYKNLVEYSKSIITRDNEIPAIVFDSEGGTFVGVKRSEN